MYVLYVFLDLSNYIFYVNVSVLVYIDTSPYFHTIDDTIREFGLRLQVSNNRYIYVSNLKEDVDDLKAWIDGFTLV